jgi:hypothetical protein
MIGALEIGNAMRRQARRTEVRLAFVRWTILFGLLGSSPAFAQLFPGTKSVNDCTFLQDSEQVRRCIESYQGAVQAPDALALPETQVPLIASPPSAAPSVVAPPRLSPAPPPRLAAP